MWQQEETDTLSLTDGSRVAVVGGGPAGSFFGLFLLDMARMIDLHLEVDIYEPRDFTRPGPAGCNHCGGIVSESLVQSLAAEGINLPPTVIQRGIDSYALHSEVETVRIETPLQEKRIAAVFRGSGPRGMTDWEWESLDAHLLSLAVQRGARVIRERVEGFQWLEGRPQLRLAKGLTEPFDLAAVAVGVNGTASKLFSDLGVTYSPPKTTKTFICEIPMDPEAIAERLGSSMHVFLLNLPRLEFGALIPKGRHVTLCLLGEDIDDALIEAFLQSPPVARCLPVGLVVNRSLCQCAPRLNTKGGVLPFGDRVVMVGDCGVTRLYKDGIGAAHRTGKAAAVTAILHGISAEDFRRHYWPVCRRISADNTVGKMIFLFTRVIQWSAITRRAVLRMARREQSRERGARRMSTALWDLFTGSAPYREVFLRTLHPLFWGRLLWNLVVSVWPVRRAPIERSVS